MHTHNFLRTLYQSGGSAIISAVFLSPACLLSVIPLTVPLSRKLLYKWSIQMSKMLQLKINVTRKQSSHCEGISTSKAGKLYVHLNQQTLLSTILYLSMWKQDPIKLIMNFEFALIPLVGWVQYFLGGIVIVRQRPIWAKRSLATVVNQLQ